MLSLLRNGYYQTIDQSNNTKMRWQQWRQDFAVKYTLQQVDSTVILQVVQYGGVKLYVKLV
jgi:hypothetical protein